MSLFAGSRKKRCNYRRVVHSISDSDNEEHQSNENSSKLIVTTVPPQHDRSPEVAVKTASSGKLLRYLHDEEEEGDDTEFKLKKPDHSKQQQHIKRNQRAKEKLVSLVKASEVRVKDDNEFNVLAQMSKGEIPNAAAIHAARKRRELARNTGAEAGNFMSLTSSAECVAPDTARANDEDDNSDEEAGQIRQFGLKQDPDKQMEVLSAMDNAESGSDEDKFEEEQIHKGSYAFSTLSAPESQYVSMQYEEPCLVQSQIPAAVLESSIRLTPISIESIKSQLCSQLSHLHERRSSNEDSIRRLSDDLDTAQNEIKMAESMSLILSMRYQFFQEMKGYVKDLLLCLTEKIPKIKDLEEGIILVLKQKSELLVERRRQDIEDAVEECAGRLDPVRQSRIVEREGRRRRRKEIRYKLKESADYYEGLSSDDELLESTKMKFKADIDEVVSKQDDVFSDVLEDFSNISQVIMRFREWKYNFSESYDQAYVSLCLPKLIVPYVQLELIPWRPNSKNGEDVLESSTWIKELLFFVEQYKNDSDAFDSDVNIIPRVVELAILPNLSNYLQSVWDPLSCIETETITKLIHYIINNFPSISLDCRFFQVMSRAIVRRIKEILQNDIYVPMFPQEKMQDLSSLHYIFSQRQFWNSFKLLKNILMFYGILKNDMMIELVVDGLMNRYMLLSLQNTPVSTLSVIKLKKIFSLLPIDWWTFPVFTKKNLAGFVRYIGNLIEILQKNLLTEAEFSKQNTRDSIEQALALLKQLECTSLHS